MIMLHLQTWSHCCHIVTVPKTTQEMHSLILLLLVMILAPMEQF